jgi:hypothetical protein
LQWTFILYLLADLLCFCRIVRACELMVPSLGWCCAFCLNVSLCFGIFKRSLVSAHSPSATALFYSVQLPPFFCETIILTIWNKIPEIQSQQSDLVTEGPWVTPLQTALHPPIPGESLCPSTVSNTRPFLSQYFFYYLESNS